VLALPSFANAQPSSVAFDRFDYTGRDPVPSETLQPGEFRNPILTGFYPDPSICQVGEDYYLINSTFAYFPGIPIFHSRDLVNWKQIGHVIDRPEQLPYDKLGVSRGIFAPAISYHDGTFYVVCTMIDAGGNFVMTAKDPAGPWSDSTWLHFEGIDPSLFFDDDGRAWMLNNGAPIGQPLYSGHRAIWIQEFDPGARRMIGPRKLLINGGVDISQKPVWIEGPHLYKRDGWYYLCCAEGGTSVNHTQVIFRSRAVDGPYVPWEENPIITQRNLDGNVPFGVTSTGHADLVIGPDKNWWAVFLAVRPYDGRHSPMGRETFLLPVDWPKDGWPRILEAGKRVPLVVKAPAGVALQPASPPLNGNFTWSDDFDAAELSPLWIMLRAPRETWWKLDPTGGKLTLEPRAETLAGDGNPSFLARRVQHARFTATTSLEVPAAPGVSAGLAVFQGEHFHYFLAAKREADGVTLYLEKHQGGAGEVIASVQLPAATSTVQLRVEANDATCAFSYAAEPDAWKTLLAGADAKMLTTDVAGGFVGAVVGMHARRDARPKAATAGANAAWAGGWEHKKIAEALEAKGHKVFRPTLTGQGERVHLANADVDLAMHIQDIVNFIEWENLNDVVLLGHSYGGMVITGVADRVASRLKHVIYLDAFLPENGESAQTSRGANAPSRPAVNGFFSIGDQTGKPVPHVVPQPEKTFTQPIVLEHQGEARKVPTTYILTADKGKTAEQDGFFRFYERAKARGWATTVMEGDHVVHLSKTNELATLLEEAL
jgi:alpha-N-arabinofuranosidase